MTYGLLLLHVMGVLPLLGKMCLLHMRRDTHGSHPVHTSISHLCELLGGHLGIVAHVLSHWHNIASHAAVDLLLRQHLLLSLLVHHVLLPHLSSEGRILCGHCVHSVSLMSDAQDGGLTTYSAEPGAVPAVAAAVGTVGSCVAWPGHADSDAYRP